MVKYRIGIIFLFRIMTCRPTATTYLDRGIGEVLAIILNDLQDLQ